ncbi:Hypothetical protein GSB_153666 [Giardia duodenalis]|uniref:Uncharacterized protein n=1 Tax=Giardia intestinalis TaxID=5741 RepID=V6TSH7_GIAIN|nr:Hypothetical protein GSB_153666 [Giardia intestinalis]
MVVILVDRSGRRPALSGAMQGGACARALRRRQASDALPVRPG